MRRRNIKKEYESPEIHIEYFDISSTLCMDESGFGLEEEEGEKEF